jgi:hypothetical protein
MRQQEHDQDRHHVDEWHQREMAGAVAAFSMPFDSV